MKLRLFAGLAVAAYSTAIFAQQSSQSASSRQIGAAIAELRGAIWADKNNDGYVDGYVYSGQYYPGVPANYVAGANSTSTPRLAAKATPQIRYPTTDAEIAASWGPLARLVGSIWSNEKGDWGSRYDWAERGKSLTITPLFKDPRFDSVMTYKLVGYGRIELWSAGSVGATMQLQPDGSYSDSSGNLFRYVLAGDEVRVEILSGPAKSSSMTKLSEQQAAVLATRMRNKWLAEQRQLAELQRQQEEEDRQWEEQARAEQAEMEARNNASAAESWGQILGGITNSPAPVSSGGGNAYTILRGMADQAGAAADASQDELNKAIASAGRDSASRQGSSGAGQTGGGYLTVSEAQPTAQPPSPPASRPAPDGRFHPTPGTIESTSCFATPGIAGTTTVINGQSIYLKPCQYKDDGKPAAATRK